MFKIFGLAGAVLVFVAVHALTADNLLAALAGLCFLKLLTACLGDAAKVERLIDYEIRKDPKLSRLAAVVSALDRLYMDRRAT